MKTLPKRDKREFGIFRYFIHQNIFSNLIYLLVFISGIVLWFWVMNREAFGNFDFDLVQITTGFPGATPEEVEQLVTMPIENALKTVEGIDEMRSISVEGLSLITLQMDPDAKDPRKNVRSIEKEVELVRTTDLPDDGDEPRVIEITAAFPVVTLGISGDVPEMTLRNVAEKLEEDILDIDGVSRVNKTGFKEKEIWIEADQKILQKNYLSLNDLINSVRQANHTSPGGRIEESGEEIIIREISKLEVKEDVERVVVRSNEEGYSLKIIDIANVVERLERERKFTRMNGERSIELNIMKKDRGDTLKIDKEIKSLVETYKQKVDPKIQFGYANEIAFYIERRLEVLMKNGIVGIILVLIIMILFLDPQSAFWTTTAIPFAFLGGLCIMQMFGLTINLLSLFAFILVSGMLVDNGIVVAEYIERKRSEGLPGFTASSVGVSDMAIPVFGAAITTIIAFAPLSMMSGITGKFLRQMPLVLIACLLCDLFECLFILPGHLHHYNFKPRMPKTIQKIRAQAQKGLGWVTEWYGNMVAHITNSPFVAATCILIISLGLMIFSYFKVPFNIFPNVIDIFVVNFELPVGATLDRTSSVAKGFEDIVARLPKDEIDAIITQVGSQGDQNRSNSGTNVGEVRVYLKKSNPERTDGNTLIEQIRPELNKFAESQNLQRYEIEKVRGGPPTGRAIEIQIIGDNYPQILEFRDKTVQFLESLPGTLNITDDYDLGKNEIRLIPDRQAIAQAGLSVAEVAMVIRAAFDGQEATEIKRVGETSDIEVLVKLPESDRFTRKTLNKLTITNPRGRLIPLTSLVQTEEGRGLLTILRFDGYRAVTVKGDVDNNVTTASKINSELESFLDKNLVGNTELKYKFGGEEETQRESMASLVKAIIFALGLIYFVLAVLFSSYWKPIIIMSVVPFALMGEYISLLFTDKPVTLLVLIGFTGLTGVVVNNSIVMLDTFNRLRDQLGYSEVKTLIEGCKERFRPIFLTTMSTFFGVMPLGMGIGGKEPFLQDMAFSFGWGLLVCSSITLFWIPAIYMASEKFKHLLEDRSESVQ